MSQDPQPQSPQPNQTNTVVSNGVRLIGDTLIAPGTSQVLDGKVGSGLARFAVGLAARAVLGPIGWVAIGLDSYSKSTTGKGLLERISNRNGNAPAATAHAPAPAPVTAPVTPAPVTAAPAGSKS